MSDPDQLRALRAWQKQMAAQTKRATDTDVDWANTKIDPKDLGVQMGPMLTEEQFKEYMKTQGGGNVKLIRPQK